MKKIFQTMIRIENNLKLFKSTTTTGINFNKDIIQNEIKLLVVSVLSELQEDDLVVAAKLIEFSNEELIHLTKIHYDLEKKEIDGKEYILENIIIQFPESVLRKQSITFISTRSSGLDKGYNTLIMSKSITKLNKLFLHWLKSNQGLIIKSLTFNSSFSIQIFKYLIRNINDLQELGDIEIDFDTSFTQNGSLNTISVEIKNIELQKFKNSEDGHDDEVASGIFKYLELSTTLNFNRLEISRLKTDLLTIQSSGKLNFKKIPKLAKNDFVFFTTFDFILMIYENLVKVV
ncbi:hypothetical protein WICMUC_005589 [Wickerhamomyces mucosus]|uniref:Uncharacterized protein n=1 Tax=Wickerhamomyces mucosus TaxID=1378264 RepID=A0A9P8T605_9ASCO|nr:hypothetical protein WICMUC_005589 [Wickerhamomyces mucosus]